MADGLDEMDAAISQRRRRIQPSQHPRRSASNGTTAPETPDAVAAPVGDEPGVEGEGAGRFARLNTAWVRTDQADWLRQVRVAALADGITVSASDIVRLALDRLRQDGGWHELQQELVREYRSRASRKPRGRAAEE